MYVCNLSETHTYILIKRAYALHGWMRIIIVCGLFTTMYFEVDVIRYEREGNVISFGEDMFDSLIFRTDAEL
jgi:hypothetical protein